MIKQETIVYLIYIHILKYGHTVRYMLNNPTELCTNIAVSLETADFLNRYINEKR